MWIGPADVRHGPWAGTERFVTPALDTVYLGQPLRWEAWLWMIRCYRKCSTVLTATTG